jgi:hypothetical protein
LLKAHSAFTLCGIRAPVKCEKEKVTISTQRRKDAKERRFLVFGHWFLAQALAGTVFYEQPTTKNQKPIAFLCAFAITLLSL